MIDSTIYYLSYVLIVAGAFFIVVGAIGLVRMPDVFTRMHATSVTETAGAGLLIAGLMLQAGAVAVLTLKLFFVLAVFFLTAPVATHALAQAALQAGIEPLLQHDHRDRRQDC